MSSPSIYLRGIRKVDDKFNKMIAIRDACFEAKVKLPPEVDEYFDHDADEGVSELFIRKFGHDILGLGDAQYIMDHATDRSLLTANSIKESHESSSIFTIDLKRLPTELEMLELEVSW